MRIICYQKSSYEVDIGQKWQRLYRIEMVFVTIRIGETRRQNYQID